LLHEIGVEYENIRKEIIWSIQNFSLRGILDDQVAYPYLTDKEIKDPER
jgi:hypothetical protein